MGAVNVAPTGRCSKCQSENPPGFKFCGQCGAPMETSAPSRPPASLAERRQLTVMFCDLVGSTALADQLDPEELRDVVRQFQSVSVAVVDRFDGYVAQYLGDGLLVYFGFPQAHEDAPRRAAHAGLGIVEAIGNLSDQLHRERGLRLAVRVGDAIVVLETTMLLSAQEQVARLISEKGIPGLCGDGIGGQPAAMGSAAIFANGLADSVNPAPFANLAIQERNALQKTSAHFGFEFLRYDIKTLDDFDDAVSSGLRNDVSAFYISGDTRMNLDIPRVVASLAKSGKPTCAVYPFWARAGIGTKRTLPLRSRCPLLGGKADIAIAGFDVRF